MDDIRAVGEHNSSAGNGQTGDGIVVRGLGTTAKISDNNLSGLGPVDFIAQNGIQVSDGAKATGASWP